jgi:acylphosphatase
MKDIGIHCRVSGKVQGVFFRAYTQEKANALGVSGWVKNCSNGDVELEAFGTEEQMQILLEQLQQGPPSSCVKDIQIEKIPFKNINRFEIKH